MHSLPLCQVLGYKGQDGNERPPKRARQEHIVARFSLLCTIPRISLRFCLGFKLAPYAHGLKCSGAGLPMP